MRVARLPCATVQKVVVAANQLSVLEGSREGDLRDGGKVISIVATRTGGVINQQRTVGWDFEGGGAIEKR